MTTNIFKIIIGTEKEDYHDRVLEWLAHPGESHGLGSAFFQALVRNLFGEVTEEEVLRIKREFPLSKSDWADLFLESRSYALAIDDKVSLSAIHDEKVESYLRLTAEQFGKKTYASVLLTPRSLPAKRFSHLDPKHFKILLWTDVARIIFRLTKRLPEGFDRSQLQQYGRYILERVAVPEGKVKPPGRETARAPKWKETDFFKVLRSAHDRDVETFHRELLGVARKTKFGKIVFGTGKRPSWLLKVVQQQREVSLLGAQADARVWMDFSQWGSEMRDRAGALFRTADGGEIGTSAKWTFVDSSERSFLLNLTSLLKESAQIA